MKYSFTKETVQHEGHEYRQLIAEKNFTTRNGVVRKGESGGFIANGDETILSHDGSCWVYPTSYVSGKVRILDESLVYDSDLHGVNGRITLTGTTTIDNSVVYSHKNVHLESVYIIGSFIDQYEFVPTPTLTIPANTRLEKQDKFASIPFEQKVLKVFTSTNVMGEQTLYTEIELIEFIHSIPLSSSLFDFEGEFDENLIQSFLVDNDVFKSHHVVVIHMLKQLYDIVKPHYVTIKGENDHANV